MNQLPFFQRPFRIRYYNAAFAIIAINVVVFLLTQYIRPDYMNYIAMNTWNVTQMNWWWQPFTYMFAHIGIWHLVFNMLGLFFFGVQLERRLGSDEFLLFYLLTGTLAGLLSLLVYWLTGAYQTWLLGASGAVFAVLLAYATYYPRSQILIFGLIPVRAPVFVIGYVVLQLISMFGRNRGNVAYLTHLAGFAFAYLYLVVRLRINPIREFRGSNRY